MRFIKKTQSDIQVSVETNIDIDVNEGDSITQTDPLEGRSDVVSQVEAPVPVTSTSIPETDVTVLDEIVSLESMYDTIRDYQESGAPFTQSHVPLMIHALSSQLPKGQKLSEICPSLESDHRLMRTDLSVSMEGILDKLKSALKKTKQFFFKPKLTWDQRFDRIEARLESGEDVVKTGKSKVKFHMRNGTFDFDVLLADTKQVFNNLEEGRMKRFFKVIDEFDSEIEKELKIDRNDANAEPDNEDEILQWITREAKRVNPTKFFIGFEPAKIEGQMVVPNATYGTMCYSPRYKNNYPWFRITDNGKEGYADYLTLAQCKTLFAAIKEGEAKMVKDIDGSCFYVVYLTCIEGINQLYYSCEHTTTYLLNLIEQSLDIK